MNDASLRITEIFYSLQGEAVSSGYPTVFIRLTGCPLRCHYCDSEYAFHGGERMLISDILARINDYACARICVTGGEPLAQPSCLELLNALCEAGYDVSLETSGAIDISNVDQRVSVVLDLKTPASGESDKNLWANVGFLKKKDQLKFVVCDKNDFDWACFKIDEYDLTKLAGDILLSPSYGQVEPQDLAHWLLESKRPLRLQTQLHKYLWGDKPGV